MKNEKHKRWEGYWNLTANLLFKRLTDKIQNEILYLETNGKSLTETDKANLFCRLLETNSEPLITNG